MLDYVKCLECGIENSKVSTFLDLTLPIRPFGRTEVYQHLVRYLGPMFILILVKLNSL